MAIPETPILRTVLHLSRYQVLLKNGGGQVLGRHWSASTLPRHLRHLASVHLRNVRAYILFDCPRGIFADNHKKYLHDCILIVTFVERDFYEMRVSVGNNEYRTVLFAVDNENIILSTRIYVLNAFKKKSKQDYKPDKIMTEFDINKLEGLHTASELLDKKYGRKGTESREEFDGKARAWYYGEILRTASAMGLSVELKAI